MASTVKRRPLPALVSLLALLLLTGLVWWRVLHRGAGTDASAAPCPSPTSTQATLPPPGSIVVKVLNSTTRPGIGSKARAQLMQDGFQVPSPAANDRAALRNKIKVVAEIRYGLAGRPSAALLHYYLPGARLTHSTSKTSVVEVSLGTRYRGIAEQSAVHRAMLTAKVALASASPTPSSTATPTC